MKLIGSHTLITKHGRFVLHGFEHGRPSEIVIALVRNDPGSKGCWTVRIQYGCLTGTVFHSLDCDCARQLDYSIQRIAKCGRGLILYFPKREANGAGLAAKIRMIAGKEKALVESREAATGMVDAATEVKKLRIVKRLLHELKIADPIHLLTNSPIKVSALKQAGVEIQSVGHIKVRETDLSQAGKNELRTKRDQLGYL